MAAVRVTVLGCSGTHPAPDRLCSSYLVEAHGYRLLLDCGNGSLTNLQRVCDVAELDAVIVSHLHPDHFADLYGLYYALRFHRDGPRSVPVYAPAGAPAHIAQLLPPDSFDTFVDCCRFRAVSAGDVLELGPLRVTLFAAHHPVETLASRVESGGTVFSYSADSAATPAIVDCARDADLFAADCTWLDREGPYPPGTHMTGLQAGAQAEEAGARRLLVTHVLPAYDPVEVAAEAARSYGGQVLVARDRLELGL
ncbi:MAG: MBL fold metallo-hydrolase [Actinomycetota bacterium]|nr:MBL fold metallo-hydrolase [Actinomycetota bacterium]